MRYIFLVVFLAVPAVATAHEVYVLTFDEIVRGIAAPAVSPMSVMMGNLHQFVFWALVTGVTIPTLFAMSLSRRMEKILHPIFARVRTYAPLLVRVGVGGSLLAFAYAGSIFGPEIPLMRAFGSFAPLVSIALAAAGAGILFNVYSRLAGLLLLIVYAGALLGRGVYVLTYIEYAAAAVFFIIGASHERGGVVRAWSRLAGLLDSWRPYRFAILRMGFGLSVMFASLYAKVIYSALALMVIEKYDLTQYTIFSAFSPEFLVLGAAIVEFLCGLLIFLGIEVRHTAAFLAFWLTLSLVYFQEMVWPHIILFGLGGAFLLYGYDWYSLEGRYFKRGNRETIL